MTKTSLLATSLFVITACVAGCSSSTDDETPVGVITAGVYSVDVHQEGAAVASGVSSRFVMKVTGGTPTTITGWIGVASGEGSVKKVAVYDSGDGDFDDDVVAPSPIPAGSQFWIEVDTAGKKDVGSIAWKK
jgi:hypothetical protein